MKRTYLILILTLNLFSLFHEAEAHFLQKEKSISLKSENISHEFYQSIIQGDIQKMEKLIDVYDIDVNKDIPNINKENSSWKPIQLAVLYSQIPSLKSLFQKEAHIHTDQNPPLLLAAWKNNIEMMKVLIDLGAKVNQKCSITGMTALHEAVRNNNKKAVEFLTPLTTDLSIIDNNNHTPFYYAVDQGLIEIAEILANHIDLNQDDEKDHFLAIAIHNRDKIMARLLIEKLDIRVDKTQYKGKTPLRLAFELGRTDIMEVLVDEGGADINELDERGWNFLHFEAQRASGFRERVVHTLLRLGINKNHENKTGQTGLSFLKVRGYQYNPTDVLKMDEISNIYDLESFEKKLIDDSSNIFPYFSSMDEYNKLGSKSFSQKIAFGADINQVIVSLINKGNSTNILDAIIQKNVDINTSFGPENYTFLFWAVQQNQYDIADILIKLGADPNKGTRQGKTPLHQAVINKNEEMIRLLVEARADTDAMTQDGKTALSLAIAEAQSPELVSFLVEDMGASINDPRSIPLLHLAIHYNQMDTLEYLLDVGTYIDQLNQHGRTTLQYAIMKGNAEAVKILSKYYPDFSITDEAGWDIVHLSTLPESSEVLKTLVSQGLPLNKTNLKDSTPFHLAFYDRSFKKMNILAQAGVDTFIQDETLFSLAWEKKDIRMIIFLTFLKMKAYWQPSSVYRKNINKIKSPPLQNTRRNYPQQQGFMQKASSLCQQLLQRFHLPQ